VDLCTGMLSCNAILAALNARHATGRGQKVETSLFETSLTMLANVAANWLLAGRDGGRYGNGHPSLVPYTIYRTADALIALGVGNPAQFRRFAETLGHPEWAGDPRFATNAARVANRDAIDEAINDALSSDTADAWLARLQAAGIPCGRTNTVAQAYGDAQAEARRMIETVEHPEAGPIRLMGIPFKFSETPASVRRAPPRLGEHTEAILRDELGMEAGKIAKLRKDGVV
jgi:crotonobetainyl-CoA:carnitine CoA-transferase CaiB-like acyl-CoA transferase